VEEPAVFCVATKFRQMNQTALFAKIFPMAFPIKVCAICSEEFELKPDKPGFANRCPECTEKEQERAQADSNNKPSKDAIQRKTDAEANEARREAMRNLLYRKDS
jgi:hypothetical protein